MEDTQSAAAESETTCDEDQTRLRMSSFIDTLKANRKVFSHLPEIIEQWYKEETKTTDQSETTEQGRDDLERLAKKRSEMEKELTILTEETNRKTKRVTELDQTIKEMTSAIDALKSENSALMSTRDRRSAERELKKKDNAMEENKKQLKLLEEGNSKLKEELKEREKERKKKIKEQEEKITRLGSELEKKERQIMETARRENEKVESLKNEHQKKVDELSHKIQKTREELSKERDRNQEMFEEYSRIIKNHKSRIDVLRKELEEKEEKVTQYTQRLASLSEKRVKQDQRLVEDTTSSNRPSQLRTDFIAFFDNERFDACENMQSIYQNKEDCFVYCYYPRLACMIFETAYEVARAIKEAASDLSMELLKRVIHEAPRMGEKYLTTREVWIEEQSSPVCTVPITINVWGDKSSDPKDLADGIQLNFKETADTCSLQFLEERVKAEASKKWWEWYEKDKSCMFQPADKLIPLLEKYIKACLRLTWKMVTQVPPMKLEFHSSKFDKHIHKNQGYHSSQQGSTKPHSTAEEQEEEIEYYLWPGLQDGGGRKICEAEVICKVKE